MNKLKDVTRCFNRISNDESWQGKLIDAERQVCLNWVLEMLTLADSRQWNIEKMARRVRVALNTFNEAE